MSFLKNRTVVGVICILLSLLICFGLTPLFNQSVSQKAEIVRVVQPIRAGDEITESMVQIVEVGGYNLPEDVLRQKESVVGKYATADLAVGDYIIPSKLSDAPAAENAYLYSLDGSQQAISVSIKSFAEGLSGKLQSGDIVSVIAPDYKQQGQTVVPAELQYAGAGHRQYPAVVLAQSGLVRCSDAHPAGAGAVGSHCRCDVHQHRSGHQADPAH